MSDLSHLKAKVARGELLREDEVKLVKLCEALTAELATYKAGNVPVTQVLADNEALAIENNDLTVEIERLNELLTRAGMAFAKYGVHARDCKYWRYREPDQCTCGFEQARKGVK